MKRYDLIDHTADIAIKAYGENLPEAYASAAEGLFEIITGQSDVESRQTVEIEVESIDMEGLLVEFLSKLLLLFEIDNLVLKNFSVTFTGENQLKATAVGETFDENRHGHGYHVKGVSYHMMEIFKSEDNSGTCHVQVLFDI